MSETEEENRRLKDLEDKQKALELRKKGDVMEDKFKEDSDVYKKEREKKQNDAEAAKNDKKKADSDDKSLVKETPIEDTILINFEDEIMGEYLKDVKKKIMEKEKPSEKKMWKEFATIFITLLPKLKHNILMLHGNNDILIEPMIIMDKIATILNGDEKNTKIEEEKALIDKYKETDNDGLIDIFLKKMTEMESIVNEIKLGEDEEEGEKDMGKTIDLEKIEAEMTNLEKKRIEFENKKELFKKLTIGSKITWGDGGQAKGVLYVQQGENYLVKVNDQLEEVKVINSTIKIGDGNEEIKSDLLIKHFGGEEGEKGDDATGKGVEDEEEKTEGDDQDDQGDETEEGDEARTVVAIADRAEAMYYKGKVNQQLKVKANKEEAATRLKQRLATNKD